MLNIALWGVSAALCLSVVYGPYSANAGRHAVHLVEADIYNGLARTTWAIGVSYLIISCSLGQGGKNVCSSIKLTQHLTTIKIMFVLVDSLLE